MASKDTNIGAKRARDTRTQLGIDPGAPIGCVLTVVERGLGIPVVVAALPEGIAGCCWRDGDQVVLWVNGTQAAVRQRFTLAHELGHVRCGHDTDLPVETYETIGGKSTDSREVQANAFAAELLAPAQGVRDSLDGEPSLETVVLIAARFGISPIAALYRLNSLGLTSRYEVLKQEINDGLHEGRWAPEAVVDAIAAIDPASLPRLSPALDASALAAVAAGSASVAAAAACAGCDPERLASGAAAIGV
jgi:Zn-dependent peptidase ImmA (M78 family)